MSPILHARLQQRLRASGGYTIDQTILIVAIIAILVTMIIITVGWNLINKSSGTKLASQMRQIEDANGQFYASYRTWPHQSYSTSANDPNRNMLALQGSTVDFRPVVTSSPDGLKNFAPGFRANASGVVQHNFGSGGAITQRGDAQNPFGLFGNYIVIQFAGVPFSEVETAERAIDGEQNVNYSTGRVVAVASTANCYTGGTVTGVAATTGASTPVNACYAANLLQ